MTDAPVPGGPPVRCPKGFLCATPATKTICPKGHFCPYPTTAAIACTGFTHCPREGLHRPLASLRQARKKKEKEKRCVDFILQYLEIAMHTSQNRSRDTAVS